MRDAEDFFGTHYVEVAETLHPQSESEDDARLLWTLLDLAPGFRVLDAPSGHGRVASALAARGCEIVGLDRSMDQLQAHRPQAPSSWSRVCGDLRHLPLRRADFDAIVCWGTSIGMSGVPTDRLLAEYVDLLAPGGRIGLDQLNIYAVLRHLDHGWGASFRLQVQGDEVVDVVTFDPLTQVLSTDRRWTDACGAGRASLEVEMYTPRQLGGMLVAAGFDRINCCDETGGRPTAVSRRLVWSARKAGA